MVYTCSSLFPLYIVTEHPKSGGTWLGQILSEYFDVPFPRNGFPVFTSSVMHGHYRYFPTMKNVFVLFRDGRDVMVSYYFHCMFLKEGLNNKIYRRTRNDLKFEDYNDVKRNLPRFIEYLYKKKPRFDYTWSEFVQSWVNRDVSVLYYENMLIDAYAEVSKAISETTSTEVDRQKLESVIEKYSFAKQTGRLQGNEDRNSFLRKGIAGDWKNYFNKNSCAVFDKYAGRELIMLGYEDNNEWTKQF